MRILFPEDIDDLNTYLSRMVDIIDVDDEVDVRCGAHYFWRQRMDFDIIHFHWPENIWRSCPVAGSKTGAFDRCLAAWQDRARIVVTAHNRRPHRPHLIGDYCFDRAYMAASAVVHLDEDSALRYPFVHKRNAVVPHPLYRFEAVPGRDTAREAWALADDDVVVAVVGSVRREAERHMVVAAMRDWEEPRKRLLWPQMYPMVPPPATRQPLQRVAWHLFARGWIPPFAVRCTPGLVDRGDLVSIVSASDILLLPRWDVLNSGSLYLGLGCDRVVVGPDTGNVGAILRRFGMPTFASPDMASVRTALMEGYELARSTAPGLIAEQARSEWSDEAIRSASIDLYRSLLDRRDPHP